MKPILSLLVLLVVAIPVFSGTLHVPGDHPTIQAAIYAATDGDVVLVAPGSYLENLNTLGKSIVVKSSHGPAVTTINGGGMGPVVLFNSGETLSTVLEGFFITKGYGTGVWCWSASPTIVGNVLFDNVVSMGGSGGGGITCNNSVAMIRNNILYGNSAYSGGGIRCHDSSPSIINNTICWNKAMDAGGGISCGHDSAPVVTNGILWDNEAPKGPEIYIGDKSHPSSLTIQYSNLKDAPASVWAEQGCSFNFGNGMILDPPELMDAASGDVHLKWDSPCRDAGENSVVRDLNDFEGDPRIESGTVDVGADEFHDHLYHTGDAVPGGQVAMNFVGPPGTSPVGLVIGFSVFDPPLPGAYGDWYLKPPMFIIPGLGTLPPEGVLILPGILPASPAGPYMLYFQSLLGSELTNLCIMNVE